MRHNLWARGVKAGSVLLILTLGVSACGATPASPVIDNCIIGPNNSCVGADLKAAVLAGEDVRGTDFTLARFNSADLRGANFAGANLYAANLRDARVEGANFAATNLIGATCPNGKVASGAPAKCLGLPEQDSAPKSPDE